MKTKIITLAVFLATAGAVGMYPVYNNAVNAKPVAPIDAALEQTGPRIQLAILLDTSSSMDGLIDQARNQLWEVVNTFARSKKNGKAPKLEVAVYEYGNSRLSNESGYIRQVSALTGELDQVSEALFALTTSGGDEYCGYVIKTAVQDLKWSDSADDIKAIFIAGNEPFTQGPIPFQHAIARAKQKGITVNTIHAGDHRTGAQSGWRDGAVLAGGDYMNIDHNYKVVHIEAPQDKRLAELNQQLNQTYIPYGAKGKEKKARQIMQDQKSNEISASLMAKRATSKASSLYNNSSWDLIDALENKAVKLEKIEEEALPQEMRKMEATQRKEFVQQKAKQRHQIKEEIGRLSKQRDAYVAKKKSEAATPAVKTMDSALTQAVIKQGKQKNYQFTN